MITRHSRRYSTKVVSWYALLLLQYTVAGLRLCMENDAELYAGPFLVSQKSKEPNNSRNDANTLKKRKPPQHQKSTYLFPSLIFVIANAAGIFTPPLPADGGPGLTARLGAALRL